MKKMLLCSLLCMLLLFAFPMTAQARDDCKPVGIPSTRMPLLTYSGLTMDELHAMFPDLSDVIPTTRDGEYLYCADGISRITILRLLDETKELSRQYASSGETVTHVTNANVEVIFTLADDSDSFDPNIPFTRNSVIENYFTIPAFDCCSLFDSHTDLFDPSIPFIRDDTDIEDYYTFVPFTDCCTSPWFRLTWNEWCIAPVRGGYCQGHYRAEIWTCSNCGHTLSRQISLPPCERWWDANP